MKKTFILSLISIHLVTVGVGAVVADTAQITPATGYQKSFDYINGAGTGLDFLSNNNWLTIRSGEVREYNASGTLVATPYSQISDPWPAFVLADATGNYGIAGSTGGTFANPTGTLHCFSLDGSASATLNFPGIYDAAFDSAGHLIVSGTNGQSGNALWQVEVSRTVNSISFGTPVLLGVIGGASGPIEFDQNGNLFVGTFDAETWAASLLAFSADKVTLAMNDPLLNPLTIASANSTFNFPGSLGDMTVDDQGNIIWQDYSVIHVLNITTTKYEGIISFAATPGSDIASATPYGAMGTLNYHNGLLAVVYDSNNDYVLDSIAGIVPIPEPATLVLVCLAGLIGLVRRK